MYKKKKKKKTRKRLGKIPTKLAVLLLMLVLIPDNMPKAEAELLTVALAAIVSAASGAGLLSYFTTKEPGETVEEAWARNLDRFKKNPALEGEKHGFQLSSESLQFPSKDVELPGETFSIDIPVPGNKESYFTQAGIDLYSQLPEDFQDVYDHHFELYIRMIRAAARDREHATIIHHQLKHKLADVSDTIMEMGTTMDQWADQESELKEYKSNLERALLSIDQAIDKVQALPGVGWGENFDNKGFFRHTEKLHPLRPKFQRIDENGTIKETIPWHKMSEDIYEFLGDSSNTQFKKRNGDENPSKWSINLVDTTSSFKTGKPKIKRTMGDAVTTYMEPGSIVRSRMGKKHRHGDLTQDLTGVKVEITGEADIPYTKVISEEKTVTEPTMWGFSSRTRTESRKIDPNAKISLSVTFDFPLLAKYKHVPKKHQELAQKVDEWDNQHLRQHRVATSHPLDPASHTFNYMGMISLLQKLIGDPDGGGWIQKNQKDLWKIYV